MVMMKLEDRALQWHQHYSKLNGGLSTLRWLKYVAEMRKRFNGTEFSDLMSDLVSLKQTTIVETYYEDFLVILNSLQLPKDYALSVFISNLKSDIYKL